MRNGCLAVLGMGSLLFTMLTSCSDGKSDPPFVSSLHYVEVTTGTLDGESVDSREEGYYQAPDSARVVGTASYSPLGLEQIVIGQQFWRRDSSGWVVYSTCYTALDKINSILRYGGQHVGANQISDGPMIDGEPTHRYRWEYEDAGRALISASELTLGDSPSEIEAHKLVKETFSDLTGTTELVAGKNTGRVYSLIQTVDGHKLTRRSQIVVDGYDVAVDIQPPPDVPAATVEDDSNCLNLGDDFPWIPAVAVAILGPILLLAVSSFLWPRRL
jgi:hypothetical protein